MLEVKVKKLNERAQMPVKNHSSDACWDLFALEDGVLSEDGCYIQYKTGIAIELPQGYDAYIYSRSSVSKYNLVLANSVGVIDETYRGEILLRFKIVPSVLNGDSSAIKTYKAGDRIGQIHIQKRVDFIFVEQEDISETNRGIGGFGSTGQ